MTVAALPTLETLRSRRDPAAALQAQVAKWTHAAAHHRARGERTSAARAERLADQYRSALALTAGVEG